MIIASVILLIYLVSVYNGLVKARNATERSFATVDVMLKKRHDLIPNLIASVKKIMQHEVSLLERITALRTQALSASGKQQLGIESQLGAAMGQLTVAMENYPDIKSDRNMLQFQASLNDVEEQISASRNAYNGTVNRYNNKVDSFPASFIAQMFGFVRSDLFEATEAERGNVDVDQLLNS